MTLVAVIAGAAIALTSRTFIDAIAERNTRTKIIRQA